MEKTKLYKETVEITYDDKKHVYWRSLLDKGKWTDQEASDGVTSILDKTIAKNALVYWAANMAAAYIEKELPVGKKIDELLKKKLIEGCKTSHRTFKQNAADYGTLLHSAIEQFIRYGKSEPPENETLRKGFYQFLEWVKTNDVEFKSSERIVHSREHNFTGRLDFTAIVKGKRVIGDLKTSSGIYESYHLQLAGYKLALQEEFPEMEVDHTVIVRCGKDGAFEIQELNDYKKNSGAFLGALVLYRRLKEMKFNSLTQTA